MFIYLILKNKIFRNFGIYTISTFLIGFINLVLLPVYSSYIEPADYGKLNLLIYLIGIGVLIADMGQNMSFFVRFHKTETNHQSSLLMNSFLISFISFLPLLIIGIIWKSLLSYIIGEHIPYSIQLQVLLIIFITVFSNFFTNFLRLTERAGLYLFTSVVKSLIMGGLNILFLVYLHQSYDSYLNAIALSLSILCVFGGIYFVYLFDFTKVTIELPTIKRLLKIGLPLMPYGFLMLAFTSGDKFIMNTLLTTSMVGVYAFAYRIGSIVEPIITSPFGQAVSPFLFRIYNESLDKFIYITRLVWATYIFLACSLLLGLSVFGDLLYHFFIDRQYWGSFSIVFIIMTGYLIIGMGVMLGGTIIVKEKTFLSPIMMLITGSINFLANIIMIKLFGIYGAAFALLIGALVSFGLYYYITQRYIHIRHAWFEISVILIVIGAAVIINILLSDVYLFSWFLFLIKGIIALISVGVVYNVCGNKLKSINKEIFG